MLEMTNKIDYGYDSLDEAFPPCDPGCEPTGYRVLFQLRTPKAKTRGGIILTDEARETDQWNTQVAKVVAVGPLAFKDRSSGEPWIDGAWCEVGDFVRIPKYGGDKFTVTAKEETVRDEGASYSAKVKTEVIFVIFRDADISAKVRDPLSVVAYT